MRIMYYIRSPRDRKRGFKAWIAGWAIMIRTFSKKTHVEWDFEDAVGPNGENCFSSSGLDGGARWKQIDFSHPERWEEEKLPAPTGIILEQTIAKCNEMDGWPYGHKEIWFNQFLPFGVDDENAVICSECCAILARLAHTVISPIQLYKRVERLLDMNIRVPLDE